MSKWDHLIESDGSIRRAYRALLTTPTDPQLWLKLHREAKRSGGYLAYSGNSVGYNVGAQRRRETVVTDVRFTTLDDAPNLNLPAVKAGGVWSVYYGPTENERIVVSVIAHYLKAGTIHIVARNHKHEAVAGE